MICIRKRSTFNIGRIPRSEFAGKVASRDSRTISFDFPNPLCQMPSNDYSESIIAVSIIDSSKNIVL